MAEKTETQIFTIPLKDAWNTAYKRRAKRCMSIIRSFAAQHMKKDPRAIKLGQALNQRIWERGIKNPPRDVRVQMIPQEADGTVWIELAEVEFTLPEKAVPRAERPAPGIAGLRERLMPKIKEKAEAAAAEKIEEAKEKAEAAKEEKAKEEKAGEEKAEAVEEEKLAKEEKAKEAAAKPKEKKPKQPKAKKEKEKEAGAAES